MQRYKLIILSLVLSVGAALGVATVSQAKWSDNIQGQNKVTVAEGQTHQGSLYAAGDTVVIDGTVEGSLYCAGRDVVITGEVTGDVLCAVQSMSIEGTVGQDVRLAGQYASINGAVAGSVTFFGQDLKLLADSSVAGDINGAGQSVTIGGPVAGDVLFGAESLTVQSTVNGNVDAGAARIELTSGGQIAGNLNYSAEQQLTIDESRVGGEVSYNPVENTRSQNDSATYGWLIFVLVSMLVCSLIVAGVAPHFVERSRAIASKKFALVSLVGFAVVFGTPILSIMLMTTVVLLPVGFVLMLLWVSALLISHVLFAYWLGSVAFGTQRNILVRMMVGVAILFVLYLLPVVNFFAGVIATVVGSGMLASTVFDGYKQPSYLVATKPAAKKRK